MKLHVALAVDEMDAQKRLLNLATRRCPDDPEGEMRRLEDAADETIEMMRNGMYTAETDPVPVELAVAAAAPKAADVKVTIDSIEKAIKKLRMFLVQNSGDTNPQVVKMVLTANAEVEAFEAVLHSLKGRHTDLRIYAQ